MNILVIIPTQKEFHFFLKSCTEYEFQAQDSTVGRLAVVQLSDLGITLARGGLGKVQFAVQTQHLLDAHLDWDFCFCAGAAGALVDGLSVGDVVVATETVEHDINNKFGPPLLPRFRGAETIIADLRSISPVCESFKCPLGLSPVETKMW